MFKSPRALASGVHYLDRDVQTVAFYRVGSHQENVPIRIYGNPLQPDFNDGRWAFKCAFCYKPHPSPESQTSWNSAPGRDDGVNIWVMHGPPKDRLDWAGSNKEPLQGCVAQAQKIAESKPLLCVFGHFHASYGVELVTWKENADEVEDVKVLTKVEEESKYDFSGDGQHAELQAGKQTLFVNAAWMTGRKDQVPERNSPVTITLTLPRPEDSQPASAVRKA